MDEKGRKWKERLEGQTHALQGSAAAPKPLLAAGPRHTLTSSARSLQAGGGATGPGRDGGHEVRSRPSQDEKEGKRATWSGK